MCDFFPKARSTHLSDSTWNIFRRILLFLCTCVLRRFPAALDLTRHFFQKELTSTQEKRLKAVFSAREDAGGSTRCVRPIAPAELERLTGEHDTIDEFLDALESLPAS